MPAAPVRASTATTRAKEKSRRRRGDTGARDVAASLQRYADRGIFRGLSAADRPNGRREFRFLWLTRTPMRVAYDPRTSTITFARLVPGASSVPSLVAGVKAVVREHLADGVPRHRRVDTRKALVRCAVRGGDLSLSFAVRGAHHAYAVQAGLNLVNRLFLHLQAYYPGYLIQHFGFSEE